jgi:hypothetical protein
MRGVGAVRRAARAAAAHARCLAAPAEGALADTSAFTRFTSPVPSAFNHTGILGAPPTKARARAVAACPALRCTLCRWPPRRGAGARTERLLGPRAVFWPSLLLRAGAGPLRTR